jgi:peptidoglycan/xylan/chitin deacetylase (PgdA/CDA1 family)
MGRAIRREGGLGVVMRKFSLIFCGLAGGVLAGINPAAAASCPGNPNAIGTSRTITIDPTALPRIGSMQYKTTLALEDHEVAITFDDGPLPPYTNRILDTLAAECVKVTYFLVGRQANAYPDLVRKIYAAGHVLGTHSQNHPLTFDQMALPRIEREVDTGIASVQNAAGDPRAVAPFFRIPGLLRNSQVESYLASKSIAVWSADEVADDWFRQVSAKDIVRKAMSRIEAKGHRGVLLLHDIHPATAMALPMLLRELKARGYRIVQAVPAGERLKTLPEPQPALVADAAGGWPRLLKSDAVVTGSLKTHDAKTERTGKIERTIKTWRHQKHDKFARHWRGRDPVVTAAISKKRQKTKTAVSDSGWTRFQR